MPEIWIGFSVEVAKSLLQSLDELPQRNSAIELFRIELRQAIKDNGADTE